MDPATVEVIKSLSTTGGVVTGLVLAVLYFRSETARWLKRTEELGVNLEQRSAAALAAMDKRAHDCLSDRQAAEVQHFNEREKMHREYSAYLEKLTASTTEAINRAERTMDRLLMFLDGNTSGERRRRAAAEEREDSIPDMKLVPPR